MRIHRWLAIASAAVLAAGVCPPQAPAEDSVMTQAKEYRGQVLSVDKQGIRIALTAGGETVIPHSLVIGTPRVAPPPSAVRGIEAYEKGNLKDAQLNLSKVALQYQGLTVDWAMKSMLYYGRALLAAGDTEKAGKLFDTFLETYEDEPLAIAARIGKIQIEMSKKNYEEAITQLRELALTYDQQLKPPKDQLIYAAEIYMNLARCLEAQSSDSEALTAYLQVTALYPVEAYCPEALYRAAQLYRKLDQPQKAAALYTDLIEQYADNELAKKAVQEKAALPRAADGKP